MDKEILKSKNKLLEFLDIKENYLFGDFDNRYYSKSLKKKDGTARTIKPPSYKVKTLQKKILNEILINHPLSQSAYGLSSTKGVLDNAKKHLPNHKHSLVVLDVKDFFPSIDVKMVRRAFKRLEFSADCVNALAKICTVDGSLPQGAPTSPYLSSATLLKLDTSIYNYCRKNNILYTRYFDDITLSGKTVTSKNISYVERLVTSGGFALNESKKKIFEADEIKVITSIVIGDVFDVTEEYKGKICQSYKEFEKSPSKKNWNIFMGNMAFYLYVNRAKAVNFFSLTTGHKFSDRKPLLTRIVSV